MINSRRIGGGPEWLKNDGQRPVWNPLEIGNSSALAKDYRNQSESYQCRNCQTYRHSEF